MCLTFFALMIALLDLWIVRRRGREQEKQLLNDTLRDIRPKKEKPEDED